MQGRNDARGKIGRHLPRAIETPGNGLLNTGVIVPILCEQEQEPANEHHILQPAADYRPDRSEAGLLTARPPRAFAPVPRPSMLLRIASSAVCPISTASTFIAI